IEPHEADYLVRGQSAAILCGDQRIGVVGRVAPDRAEHHGIPREDVVFVAEIDLDGAAVHTRAATRVQPLPRFPSVSRDIALLVDDTLSSATLRHTIRTAAPPSLVQVREFDRYQGKGIPDGKVSLAVRLTFRSSERTLTDGEVQTAVDAILGAARTQHGAMQR
ncbi:MAG TPA: hypothetical protein VIY56_17590, partial [Vicinamibacterales bacterium]